MKKIEINLGTFGTIAAVLLLLGGGFFAGIKSVKKDAVCTVR